jgi:pyridoxamine 5'-phosphate oxidase
MLFTFSKEDLHSDPWIQFDRWYLDALSCNEISYPHAFTLSTLNAKGYPEGRIVLMKDRSDESITFYTNLDSNKGKSLKAYPRAGASFYWDPLGRQIRLYGSVSYVSKEEADTYYASRSRESRIGAWASSQSEIIDSRNALEEKVQYYKARFEGKEVTRPPHWSGFKIRCETMEFWQFGEARLHDRFVYSRKGDLSWRIDRLQP